MTRSGLVVLVVLCACSPKPADTQANATTDGGATTGAVTSGAASSGGLIETSAGPGFSATDVPTSDPTEAPHVDPLDAVCALLCQNLVECGLRDDPLACDAECRMDVEPGSMCAGLLANQWQCVVDQVDCAGIAEAFEGGLPACAAQFEAFAGPCLVCSKFAGGEADSCAVGRTCLESIEEYRCEGDTCTCSVNMVPGATCPSVVPCAGEATDFEALEAEGAACCGWDWP